MVRVAFVDTHGLTRARPIEARHFAQAARNGVPFTTALFAMDSANNIFQNVFAKDGGFGRETMGGGGDMLAVPDLDTFRILPWARKTASVLSDLYLTDGEPCPFDPRLVMRKAIAALGKQGLSYVGGVEVECHVFRLVDGRNDLADCTQPSAPPEVAAIRHGYQHLSEAVVDELEPVINADPGGADRARPTAAHGGGGVGAGPAGDHARPALGPGCGGCDDHLRTAVKQVSQRLGLHATFMTKPGLPNVFSSGWHLHQSLADLETGRTRSPPRRAAVPTGLHYVGGLLRHVRAGTAFSNPTINGYKRLNANPLAPKRAVWSHDNKAAMCRLIGGPGDNATHFENRSGEPAANPYLFMATQIIAGLDGMANATDPGGPLNDDPYGQAGMELLPASLMDSIDALDKSVMFRVALGDDFVNHYLAMKRHEIGRFLSHVTDWEHREYFETF